MRGGTMRSMRALRHRLGLGLRRLQLQLLYFLGTMHLGLLGSTRA